MTLKVVRGLVGQSSSPLNNLNQNTNEDHPVTGTGRAPSTAAAQAQVQVQAQQGAASSASTISNLVRTSEAVVTTVKSISKALTGESRIKDISEAKEVARKVSEDVRRDEGTATAAHGTLSGNDAREHFAE